MGAFSLLNRFSLWFAAGLILGAALFALKASAQDFQLSRSSPPGREAGQLAGQNDKPNRFEQCDQIMAQLQQQKHLMTRELAQIKRELVALREHLSRPGMQEIFAGIGYILGLVGIAFYLHCRKLRKGP
ncbi:hypothetical protein [Desulfoferrobacter suflitae]|uniref:hypothetical protein n=1 Tax=Desulfoferrobacter suflitae TaxID=2865782 RepID=UPI0021641D8A|nr:hypothetical protein [Desulfoferrobacter suflitae]MCK8601200.1 hypothetical protein [Desulfoferrobacter suflitae]